MRVSRCVVVVVVMLINAGALLVSSPTGAQPNAFHASGRGLRAVFLDCAQGTQTSSAEPSPPGPCTTTTLFVFDGCARRGTDRLHGTFGQLTRELPDGGGPTVSGFGPATLDLGPDLQNGTAAVRLSMTSCSSATDCVELPDESWAV